MNFSSHAKSGLILGPTATVLSYLFTNNVQLSVVSGLLAFIGAIFPDLDTDSIPSRWAARIGFGSVLALLYLQKPYPAAWLGLLFFLIKSGKHRGFMHKYHLPTFCFAVSMITGNLFYAAFGFGLCLHFWVDKISPLELKNWR
jgi:hypothetical protein